MYRIEGVFFLPSSDIPVFRFFAEIEVFFLKAFSPIENRNCVVGERVFVCVCFFLAYRNRSISITMMLVLVKMAHEFRGQTKPPIAEGTGESTREERAEVFSR